MPTPTRVHAAIVALVVIALSAGLFGLRAEFEPEDLVAGEAPPESAEQGGPWDTPNPLEALIIVQGANVLSDEALFYADALTLRARESPWSGRRCLLGAYPCHTFALLKRLTLSR